MNQLFVATKMVIDEVANSATKASPEENRIIDARGTEANRPQDENEIMLEPAERSQATAATSGDITDQTVGSLTMVIDDAVANLSTAAGEANQIVTVVASVVEKNNFEGAAETTRDSSKVSNVFTSSEASASATVQSAVGWRDITDSGPPFIPIVDKDYADRNRMIANEKSDNHNVADENCGGCSRMIDYIYNTMDGVTFCGFGFYC